MKKSIMSKRRFEGGGEVEDKAAGLEASNKEKPMGFFERLRMGNIDDPESEAYKRLGAGRGAAERIPVEDKSFTDVPPKMSLTAVPPEIVSRSKGMDSTYTSVQARKNAEAEGEKITEGERIAQEMASKPNRVVEPTKVVKKPATKDTSNYSNEGRYKSPVGTSTVKDTPSPEKKSSDSDKASSAKKMEEDMKSYKPRYTPPGSAPKTTTQKHPPKVFMPERPDNSFPGSKYKSGGSVASSRADGIAQRGKTRGVMR